MHGRICVVWMHLNREFVSRKDELDEQREITRLSKPLAAPFGRHFAPSFRERLARERSRCHAAMHIGQPGLANRLRQVGFLRAERRPRARAPKARTERRVDAKRRGLHRSGSGFRATEESAEAPQTLFDALE